MLVVALWAQTVWTKYPTPVLRPTELFEIFGVGDNALIAENGVYKMWYTAGGLDVGDSVPKVRIAAAVSLDGLAWAKYGVVLQNGGSGAWDEGGVETASVVHNAAGYHMWFDGYGPAGYPPIYFGYAASPDGLVWTKWPLNPVMAQGGAGEWDNFWIDSPTVLFENDTFKMWYSGADSAGAKLGVGYATSTDGVTWTKWPSNPVLVPSGGWDAAAVGVCSVRRFGGGLYEMWYTGWPTWPSDIAVGYATSPDGVTWTPYAGNPVLTLSSGSWDSLGVAAPDVLLTTDYEMWYTGSFVNEIGYASSPVATVESARPDATLECPSYFGAALSVRAPGASALTLLDAGGRTLARARGEVATWNTSSLASGVYFVVARWRNRTESRAAVRLK